ncbi:MULTISPECIES: hypothetical protein [Bacteria]|uniref:Uncharacterized protein n=1 Tax=Hominibacterium faecale TaxID=2839743 RepID=A0A9J6QY87_9FIRM|nr:MULTISPECIES: hypothetical protein [Bacteria]MCU7380470.1 hypothetical protein [Hominibacterium faecale]
MDKRTLARDIQQFCGTGLVTATQVREYLGAGKNYPTKFLEGLPYYPKGKAKLYAVEDVAERINQGKQQ